MLVFDGLRRDNRGEKIKKTKPKSLKKTKQTCVHPNAKI